MSALGTMARILGESGRYLTDEVQRKRLEVFQLFGIVVAALFTIEGLVLGSLLDLRRLPLWSRTSILVAVGVLGFVVYKYGLDQLDQLSKERNKYRRGAEGESA